ncbi:MAG: hypothetical protein AAFQ79_11980 [Pseudomonadota bacterium]
MSDETNLERKLERLAASGLATGESRQLTGDRDAILRQILIEIDDTVLPRSLRLEASATRAVTVEIKGRRLLKVLGNVGAATAGLEGRSLDAEGGEDVAALKSYFEALIGTAKTVRATMQALDIAPSAGDMGLSARALAEAWSVALAPRADADRPGLVAGLISDLGDAVLGWRVDSEQTDTGGADASVSDLMALPLGAHSPLLPPDARYAMTLVQRSSGEDAIFLARIDATTAALHLTADAGPRAIAVWRKIAAV